MTAAPEPPDRAARALAEAVRRLQGAAVRTHAEARTRAAVDLATGILAERLGLPIAEAAAHLARLAREAGVPVVALAADIARLPDPAAGDVGTHGAHGTREAPGVPGAEADDDGPAAVAPETGPTVTPALAAVPDLQRAAEAGLDQTGAA
ncbi:ANTAR domain-containing protein, partial [Kitasatospora sp. NPDC059599]|uniref:ANTAR domain-containing protein n=1 Tax=Kitasatospora sp. NPDC059599 TaxID=3346880 RepID=UPI0036804BAB